MSLTPVPEGEQAAPTIIASQTDQLIGSVLDSKYELIELLGEGGMGAVYRARRVHIGDEVAVKVLHHKYGREGATLERFRREARAAAALRHPNIVAIYDYGEARGDSPAFIVMELVSGRSLRDILMREGRLTAERAVALMRDICAGVGAAHRANIVHRDLKPDNIIVLPPGMMADHETVKVVDFGIAKLRDKAGDQALTQTGAVIGTPYYMSPEQCRAEPLDARSDVYSLGAMLYEMLVGAPPFDAPTYTAIVVKHLTESPPPIPPGLNVPPALEAAIHRALSKDMNARQSDANLLARELQSALALPRTQAIAPPVTVPDSGVMPPPTQLVNAYTPNNPPYHPPTPQPQPPYPATAGAPKSSRAGLVAGIGAFVVVLLIGVAVGAWLLTRDNGNENRNASNSSVSSTTNSGGNATSGSNVPSVNTNPTNPMANANIGLDTGAGLPANAQAIEGKIVRGTLINEAEIAGIAPANLRILRNAVYARHGRTFDSPELQSYFNSRPWYRPNPNYSDSSLTDNDRANVSLLKAAEDGTAAPANAGAIRAEVIDALEGWADTIRSSDIEAHMGYYASTVEPYYRRGSVSAAVVRSERSQAFTKFSSLDVRLSNIVVTPDSSGTRATAEFDKTWRFEGERTSTGSVRQMLWL
ncbi:MAG TPA: protein kinase, partial [Blastocatellia bacterium]|nr:protein kinase [Blastocatellia bacterium]